MPYANSYSKSPDEHMLPCSLISVRRHILQCPLSLQADNAAFLCCMVNTRLTGQCI